ncbi:uncharacterized [Tachysurus ichikawai]
MTVRAESSRHEVGLQILGPVYSVYTTFLFAESSPLLNIRAVHKTLRNDTMERWTRWVVAAPVKRNCGGSIMPDSEELELTLLRE